MDRPNRSRTGQGLITLAVGVTLASAGAGCKSLRPEVPPHKPFMAGIDPTQQIPAVGFSKTPGLSALNGLPNGPASVSAAAGQLGVPGGGVANPLGAPTGNAYGAPGSAGLGVAPSLGAATGAGLPPATAPADAMSNPSTGVPQSGRGAPSSFSPVVPGSPGAFPSPN